MPNESKDTLLENLLNIQTSNNGNSNTIVID